MGERWFSQQPTGFSLKDGWQGKHHMHPSGPDGASSVHSYSTRAVLVDQLGPFNPFPPVSDTSPNVKLSVSVPAGVRLAF